MRTMRAYRSLVPAVVALICLSGAAPAVAATAMQDYVSAMQPGWNLGNTLDAIPGETSWGNPAVTQEFIQQIAAQGFKSIRIPITWTHHTGAAPGYAVDAAWMDRVQQIVDWSLAAGLHVMINMHHDSWEWVNSMPTNHDAVLAQFEAIWTQVATRFKDYPNLLMFESINEPFLSGTNDATYLPLLDELNTAFFNVVRGTGGGNATRPLVLPSLATNAGQSYLNALNATITHLNDPNLIVTVHYYGFWPFSVNIAGDTKFVTDSINDLVTQMNAVYNTFVAKGIPVIVGEYGLLAFDSDIGAIEHGEMLKFFEYFTQYARAKGITHMLWDNGQHFNRTTYQWRDPELYSVIMQSLAGRSSTADTDAIFLQDGATVPDAGLNLNLNGNSFVSLADGATLLTAGTDYVLNGSGLTVKAGALARYAQGAYGEKTVLTANFSSGPAWKIHVRHYNTPVLLAATGTTGAGLTMPAAFKGDQVATMEAVYASGGNAGPQNWTPYKQFTYTFVPNYANNTLTLTPNFFAETNGGTINLTFHFWSGKTVTYQLTGGSTVSGHPTGVTLPIPPEAQAVEAGGEATLAASATGSVQWRRNGVEIDGQTSGILSLANVQPADTGIYSAAVTAGETTTLFSAILGIISTAKVIGDGEELQPANIVHPNGNIFDQVLLTGAAETITADAGQVTRTSFIDLDDDIVQVEFAGAGSLSLVLDDASGPAQPVNYTQSVNYMKGHAGIVIAGADETSNVSVFTVGRATAFDGTGHYDITKPISVTNDPATNGSPLFVGHENTAYDGIADIAFIAILSTDGKFGGVRTANANYFAHQGLTGVYAPGVAFEGPVFIGNIEAFDEATPVIQLGSAGDARITGGDLYQDNGAAVQVSGLTQLQFTAGGDSGGNVLSAKANQAVLEQDGVNVTSQIVVNPG